MCDSLPYLLISEGGDWVKLEYCYIQDHALKILCRGLISSHVTIRGLSLWENGLTESSSSAISDITLGCQVEILNIKRNTSACENERLYSMISDPSSVVGELDMQSTKLSSTAAIKLFTALRDSKKLRILNVADNDITDEACDAIIMAMKKNTSLVELYIDRNPISVVCTHLIVEALKYNKTLQLLWLPHYSDDVKKSIRLSAEEIRKSRDFQVKLKIDFALWL